MLERDDAAARPGVRSNFKTIFTGRSLH